ncbi:MAG: methyltransferase domain-containing protein [Methanospirillum sp.]|uniref:methyltransferase domain-containing protein n=1 Tax=Methanospirillum sp. TaxID=45200 RepID=UPI00236D2D42|nr:methyltransferase domain-containing protein [Methanospirillum sp.]MDD1728271.1 methyltransferase domain-containing protein [Methanospirillum sp.]
MDSFASGFARVDTTGDAHSFVQYLDLVHSLPFFQECKTLSYERLALTPGDSVLEIGCGNGVDTKNLAGIVGASGNTVGIDISATMLDAARDNAKNSVSSPEFMLCDGHHLAFPDDTFNGVRADRVIQHTRDPFAVIKEITRVTKPSGTVVIFEPDWGTFSLWPSEREVSRSILNFWCDSIPSGWVGRSVYAAYGNAGLTEICVEPKTLIITDLTIARKIFDLDTTFTHAVQEGIVSQEAVTQWEEALVQADHHMQFFSSLTFFLVTGIKS